MQHSGSTASADLADPPALRDHPSRLVVETTNRCNLACDICVKRTSSPDAEGDFSPALLAALQPSFSRIQALVLNGVGEPLLHPGLEHIISVAKRTMPSGSWVGFQSNGMLLDDRRARSLLAAGLDTVCLSVDAVSPAAFSRLRAGGELAEVERAFAALSKAAPAGFRIGIEFVAQRDTVGQLPSVLRWAARRGATYAIVSHLLPYDPSRVSRAAYGTTKDSAAALFREWRDRSRRRGIELGRYREVYLKYRRTPEEEQIVSQVEAMKAEAINRGVFLNLDSLFTTDEDLLRRVEDSFAEARDTASELGMQLRLPETMPRSLRRCEFVEEGSAFISWDGSVHPCHFLWRSCRAYVGGREQQVTPRVFGRLHERGLAEIWNDPAYRSFRENVRRYDYPFCYNCSFALCDLVQRAPFEQDCYLNAEPCAACLWCMGIFQCLQ